MTWGVGVNNVMISFKKILVIIIRTFSHPMLAYLKRKQQQNQLKLFSRTFMVLGRRAHKLEHWLNSNVLTSTRPTHSAMIADKVALEKGIEAFYQCLFYLIVLGIPFYELYKASRAAHLKDLHE